MKYLGHIGVALLMYAPACFILLTIDPVLAYVGGAVVVSLSSLPDCDKGLPFVPHRGPTHTVLFAAIVASILGILGWFLAPATPFEGPVLAAIGTSLGLLSVGSHILADAVTPMGVSPFWPFSDQTYTLALTRADDPVANWLLLSIGVLSIVVVIGLAGEFDEVTALTAVTEVNDPD